MRAGRLVAAHMTLALVDRILICASAAGAIVGGSSCGSGRRRLSGGGGGQIGEYEIGSGGGRVGGHAANRARLSRLIEYERGGRSRARRRHGSRGLIGARTATAATNRIVVVNETRVDEVVDHAAQIRVAQVLLQRLRIEHARQSIAATILMMMMLLMMKMMVVIVVGV